MNTDESPERVLRTVISSSSFVTFPCTYVCLRAVTMNTLRVGDEGRRGQDKTKRTGGRARTSRDVRRAIRLALEIGPRRSDLSFISTRGRYAKPPKGGEWIDGREKRERQCRQSSYVDRDISSNFVSRIRRRVQS